MGCENPAPVLNQFDSNAPGYIVSFEKGVNVDAEVNFLKDNYPINVKHVYQDALAGFSAEMSDETREQLRCHETIDYIEHNTSNVIQKLVERVLIL